jgi:hypothetical protein
MPCGASRAALHRDGPVQAPSTRHVRFEGLRVRRRERATLAVAAEPSAARRPSKRNGPPGCPDEPFHPSTGDQIGPPTGGPSWPTILVARVVVGSGGLLVRTPARLKCGGRDGSGPCPTPLVPPCTSVGGQLPRYPAAIEPQWPVGLAPTAPKSGASWHHAVASARRRRYWHHAVASAPR